MARGVRDVIRRAAKGSSWSHFVDYASPALFEVMPLRALLEQGKEFVSNGSDARRYAKAEVFRDLSTVGFEQPAAHLIRTILERFRGQVSMKTRPKNTKKTRCRTFL